MVPELNREYPQENEEEIFAQMVEETISEMKPIGGFIRRGQHAKATGCVTAEFQVVDEMPDHLRHGVFAEPGRTFEALVRFSNSQGTHWSTMGRAPAGGWRSSSWVSRASVRPKATPTARRIS
jgi:hypothetical protein